MTQTSRVGLAVRYRWPPSCEPVASVGPDSSIARTTARCKASYVQMMSGLDARVDDLQIGCRCRPTDGGVAGATVPEVLFSTESSDNLSARWCQPYASRGLASASRATYPTQHSRYQPRNITLIAGL